MVEKQILLGKNLAEMQTLVVEAGMPKFTAKQLLRWLYVKRAMHIDDMTDVSAKNRILLAEICELGRYAPIHQALSTDGTKKYLFQTTHGMVETVYIPEDDRATLCVSCQVGCKMNCGFCMTGKQGWSGNLTAAEIINQILSVPDSEKLTNIVFMGMGEPFDNTLEILKALEILTSDWAMAWSPRRITVSTVGLLPGLKQFLEHSEAHLAVSLHNPFAEERQHLMPVEKAYPI